MAEEEENRGAMEGTPLRTLQYHCEDNMVERGWGGRKRKVVKGTGNNGDVGYPDHIRDEDNYDGDHAICMARCG